MLPVLVLLQVPFAARWVLLSLLLVVWVRQVTQLQWIVLFLFVVLLLIGLDHTAML